MKHTTKILGLVMIAVVGLSGQASRAEDASATLSEAKELLKKHYEAEELAAKNGDLQATFADIADDVHFSVNGKHFVGKDTLVSRYPKDFKDETYKISSLSTIAQGNKVYDLVSITGTTAGVGKAFLVYYVYEKRDGKLVVTQFVGGPVDEAALPK